MKILNFGLMDYTGLLFDCPVKEEVHDCAFRNLRKLELRERFEIWKNLSENEKGEMINRHHICIFEREQLRYKSENTSIEKSIK